MSEIKTSFADVMAATSTGRPTQTIRTCLSPTLNPEFAELQARLEDAVADEEAAKFRQSDREGNGPKRLTDKTKEALASIEIAQKIADLITENPTAFYELKFQAMPRAKWVALRSVHPPVDGPIDTNLNIHFDTFGPAAVTGCLIDPDPTSDVVAFLEEKLSTGEWERLAMLVWNLNEGARDVPKSQLATSILNGTAKD